METRVSIVIPCYKQENLLQRAVQSVLNQTLNRNLEIIVVDDGNDHPIGNPWGPKVKIIRHNENRGLCAALNTGIKASTGTHFVILASDDAIHPDFVKTLSYYADKADIISCDFLGMSGNEKGYHVKCKPGSLEGLKIANCHSYCCLVRKELFDKVGGFNLNMNPSWEDWNFFLSCAEKGATWHHVPLPLHYYYRNPSGRDAEAQGKDILLRGKMEGFHQNLFGLGKGVVTFVIPCYDHEKFLPEAVESVFRQSYPHKICIVVDDGSPGPIEKTIKELNYPVVLIRQGNKHLSGARNTGIKYAIDNFNPQYLVMLDADDKIESNYVEETLSIFEPGKYIYSDVKLFGDAWHDLEMHDYNPLEIIRKHQHPCTFLMETRMYQEIVRQRGYGYDESMRRGYEDWEFALAALHYGFCGKRLPKPLFYYRNYADNSSMRGQAAKINNELVNEIKEKHSWIKDKEFLENMCKTCGGQRNFRVTVNKSNSIQQVNVPGLGMVDVREPLRVVYEGSEQRTMTKVGRGSGRGSAIYKYTANPQTAKMTNGKIGRQFNIFGIDAHLFVGPFKFSRITPDVPAPLPQQPLVPTSYETLIFPTAQVVDLREQAPEEPKKKGRRKATKAGW